MIREFLSVAVIIGSLPNNIQNGQTADAIPVMADLNFIANQVNANAAPLANTALLNAANSFTAVQSGVAATNAANFPIASQVQNFSFNTLSSVIGTNTISARVSALPLGAYASGQVFTFRPSQPNGSSVSINIDNLGSIAITKLGGYALQSNDLLSSSMAIIVYDGNNSRFQQLNPRIIGNYFEVSSNEGPAASGSTLTLNLGSVNVGDTVIATFCTGCATSVLQAGNAFKWNASKGGTCTISGGEGNFITGGQFQFVTDSNLSEYDFVGTYQVLVTAAGTLNFTLTFPTRVSGTTTLVVDRSIQARRVAGGV